MPFMKWDTSYSVGHAEIDTQHRELVENLNQFFDALKQGQAQDVQEQLLDRFVGQVRQHFETEERELQRVDYHDLVSHRRLHESILAYVDEFAETFRSNKKRCPHLIQFLKKRFVDHFDEADRAYARYFTKVKA